MKNRKVLMAIMVSAIVVMFAGCSQDKAESTPSSSAQVESRSQVESQAQDQGQAQDQNTQDAEKTVTAPVTVKCAYENGAPDLAETLNISDVTDKPEEDGHTICGYDADGKMVYKREDSSFTDDNGVLNVTITYEFYSLEHDFDFQIDPLQPENGGSIQTLNGSIVVKSGSDETSKDFTFETVGVRGQTGIWYAGICSCRDGVLGDFIAE